MELFYCYAKRSVAFLKIFRLLFCIPVLLLHITVAQGQITYNESFDVVAATQTLPLGWAQGRQGGGNDIDNMWDRITSGTSPLCTPKSGSGMVRFQSRIINSGEASYLASKRLDMRTIPGSGAPLNFWLYREAGYPANGDRISVYVNSTPDLLGAPLQLSELSTAANVINRSCAMAPLAGVVCGTWNQYQYTIPASWNTTNVYVIILATSAFGHNIYLDDFSVTSYPKVANQSLVTSTPMVINQNSSLTAKNTINQQIIGIRITMDGNNIPRSLSNVEFNTNGSTNPATDITNAKLWFTGGTPTLNFENALLMGTVAQPWLTNYMFLVPPTPGYTGLSAINSMDHGDNFFWITYDISPGAVKGHYVDAEWIGYKLTGIQYTPNLYTLTGARRIGDVYCTPTYAIGTSWLNYTGNDFIGRVQLAGNQVPGINNAQNIINSYAGTLCPFAYPANCPFQTHPSDYEFVPSTTGKTTSITANGLVSYSISLQVGSYNSGNAIAAWIDYNQNSVFDPLEKIAQSGFIGPNGIYTTTFVPPLAALPGETRMRIREVWLDADIDPCDHRFFGETEDYVITIVRACNGPAGWSTWLGYTNEWSDPSNWCPGVAPVNGIVPDVNVVIPGGPSFAGYAYKKPVIRSGVQARAMKLRILGTDTLYIDAASNASLTVLDSLAIQNNASALVVKNSFSDSAQVYNGLLNRPLESPLKNYGRSRSLLLFTPAELSGKGLVANDRITHILLHLQRKSNGNPYKNLTIKYYYTGGAFSFTSGSAGVMPPLTGPAPVTVFSGDLNTASYIPAVDGWGTIEIALTNPVIWDGSGNQVVIEICYDNTGFASTGANDEIRFTQTTSFRKYMTMENLTAYPKAGCDILPSDYFATTASGIAGTNTVTVDPAMASQVYVGAKVIGTGPFNGSITATVINVAGTTVTLSSNVLATFTNGTLTFYNTNSFAGNCRPNLTFRFERPYTKFPIAVGGHWQNNGAFIPAISKVTMNGTGLQHINGSSTTTFYDLKIQNAAHVMRMTDFIVSDSLILTNGRLKLNNGLVTLTNTSPSALSFVVAAGDIQAETDLLNDNVSPYGRLAWDMGTVSGVRTIPFINATGVRIPMDYNIDNGAHDMMLGTYSTLPDNINWPLPDVTNIHGINNGSGGGWGSAGWAMTDRYYLVKNNSQQGAQADITFRYAAGEQAQSGNTDMRAQRWVNAGSLWEFPFQPNQVFTPGNPNTVALSDYSGFTSGNWWTIVGETTPLPVSMLEFTASKVQDKVKLSWTTASEINNSHFNVERTLDHTNYKFIDRVESSGQGNNVQHYEALDEAPVTGIQYYYLHQFDFDGTMQPYGPVAVNFSADLFEILTTISSPTEHELSVVFQYNSDEPYNYRIIDMTGRILSASSRSDATKGINTIDIGVDLSRGAYYLVLQNEKEVVTRKFFY
ncbi:MAG: GEVED domain-containing protein [Bacteroidota bacterium]|nr:GEVED domain-containing protein [Bacteroidota bacterium]